MSEELSAPSSHPLARIVFPHKHPLSYMQSLTHIYTPLPKNTEKSQEHPGNTLTKSQEHQKQHWGPQHGWDNSETGVPSRCDGQGS